MVDCVDLGADVIIPHHIGHAFVGRFPADHEHAESLIHRPFDEAFLRGQIEDVEPVDPRREDDQRHFEHGFGRRTILDQLIQRGFMHHLARRRGEVFAQPERVGIGMGQLPALHVVDQVLHPAHQILPAGFDGALHHHRVQRHEIVRAHRFGQRADREFELLALGAIKPVHALDRLAEVIGQQQIGLVQQQEGGVFAPCGIGKAPVAFGQRGRIGRFGCRAAPGRACDKPFHHAGPQFQRILRQPGLGIKQPLGQLAQHALRKHQPLRRIKRVRALGCFGGCRLRLMRREIEP